MVRFLVACLLGCLLGTRLPGQADFQKKLAEAHRLVVESGTSPADLRRAFAEALSAFLRLDPQSPAYRANLRQGAFCAMRAGRAPLAAQLFGESWKGGSRDAVLFENRLRTMIAAKDAAALGFAYAHRMEARYAPVLHRLLVDPQLYAGFYQEAAAKMRRGALLEGLWVFQRQAELLPRDPYAQANLGLALRHAGRPAPSRAAYEAAFRLLPADWIANDHGLLLKGLGERQAAVATLVRSLELQTAPGSGDAAINLAVIVQRGGKTPRLDSLRDLAAVLRRRPDSAMARRLTLDLLALGARSGKVGPGGRDREPAE